MLAVVPCREQSGSQLLDEVVRSLGQRIGRFKPGTLSDPHRVVAGRDDGRHPVQQLKTFPDDNLLTRLNTEQRERAALVYLHSSAERQRALADTVGETARAELAKSKPRKAAKPSGTRRARNRRAAAKDGK